MTQHYRTHGTSDTAVCGQDMVGRRTGWDLLFDNKTTCIKCRAVVTGRWLYVCVALDEDGNYDVNYFNTITEQVDCANEADANGSIQTLIYIVLADEIPTDDPIHRVERMRENALIQLEASSV